MPGEQVGSAYVTLGLDDSKLESGLNAAKGKVSSAVGGMGSAIGSALSTAAVAGGAAMAGIATVGVKTFMDIESAAADAASKMDLSAIAQASGQTTAQAFDQVKEHVMGLADELGQLNTNAFDPTQIAQACANLAAGGFDIAAASAADLSPILSLATATTYGLDASAGMAMATLNTFGMSVSELGHISDVYATACGASAAGMEDLNYAMQMVGPTASAYGISFETLTANLETFSQMSIRGEKAGTAMRDAITTLGAPSGSAAKALGELGFSTADVDTKSHDFNETLGRLKDAADRSGQGVSAFNDVFGVSGGLLYKLAAANTKTAEFKNSLLDCAGASEEMAKLMLDTLGGSFDTAIGAASSLAYLIGGKLAPTLRSAFDWFSETGAPAIRKFIEALSSGDFSSAGEMIGITVEKIKSAISGLVTGSGIALFGVGLLTLVPIAATMAAGVIASVASMVATSIALVASMAVGVIASVASMVATSIVSVATMVTGVIVRFATMVVSSAASWMAMKVAAVAGWLSIQLAAAAGVATTIATTLAGFAAMSGGVIGKVAAMAAAVVGAFATMVAGAAARLATLTASTVLGYATMASGAAVSVARMVVSTLTGFAAMAAGAAASVARMVVSTLAGFAAMAAGVAAAVVGTAASIVAPIAMIVAGLAGIGLAVNPGKFTTLKGIATDAFNGIKNVALDCWESIKTGDFSAVGERLQTAFSGTIDYVKQIDLSGVAADMVTAIKTGWETLLDLGQTLYDRLVAVDWAGVASTITDTIRAGWEALLDLGQTLYDRLVAVDWAGVASTITDAIRAGWNALLDLGQTLYDRLVAVDWAGVASTITDAIRVGWEALLDLGQTLYDWIVEIEWADAATTIATKIRDAWGTVTGWATAIIDKLTVDLQAWIDTNGPANIGKKLAFALADGCADLGKYIYTAITNWWTSNGSSLGGVLRSAVNFSLVAVSAAIDFVTSFASTMLKAGKGTIGSAFLDILADVFDSAEVSGHKLFGSMGEDILALSATWKAEWEATKTEIESDNVELEYTGTDALRDEWEAMEEKGLTIPVKYSILSLSKKGDNWEVISDETTEDYGGVNKGEILGIGSSRQAALEAAAAHFEDGAIKIDTAATHIEEATANNEQSTTNVASATASMDASAASTAQATSDLSGAAADSANAYNNLLAGAENQIAKALEFADSMDAIAAQAMEAAKTTALDTSTTTKTAATDSATTTTNAATDSATTTKTAATDSAASLKKGAIDGATSWKTGVDTSSKSLQQAVQQLSQQISIGATALKTGGQAAMALLQQGGKAIIENAIQAAAAIRTSGSQCGVAVSTGGTAAGNALSSAASAIRSALSGAGIPTHAGGTKTTGPEVALIGEAGSEYVIPADQSRPDLMGQAMADYGLSDTAASAAHGGYSNVSAFTVVAAGKGAGDQGAISDELAKAARMLAEATRYLAQTSESLYGAIEAMSGAARTWAETVKSTTEEINTIDSEAAQVNATIAANVANEIKELQLATADKIKDMASEMADKVKTAMTGGATTIQQSAEGAGSSIRNASATFLSDVGRGGKVFADHVSIAAGEFEEKTKVTGTTIQNGASTASNYIISGGANAASSMARGGAVAAAAIIYAAQALASAVSSIGAAGSHANGTLTNGPEVALIGEDGPEYVIPTKTKRWDLLYAAMGDYGLKVPSIAASGGGAFGHASSVRQNLNNRIVIEDHTVHELYIDGKKVTDVFMTQAARKIKTRQGALSNW